MFKLNDNTWKNDDNGSSLFIIKKTFVSQYIQATHAFTIVDDRKLQTTTVKKNERKFKSEYYRIGMKKTLNLDSN